MWEKYKSPRKLSASEIFDYPVSVPWFTCCQKPLNYLDFLYFALERI